MVKDEQDGGQQPEIDWPVKQKELVKWVVDSRPWNDFTFRPDDIIINTWSKSGTTWMQQIVGQLVFGGLPDTYCEGLSPWIEFRLRQGETERAAAQTHRRFLKSHLPLESIVYSPSAKYIYVARDARDAFWSWHNHHLNMTEEVLAALSALQPDQPPYEYPDPDTRIAFLDWLDNDAFPNWPFWSHVQGWFDARHLPNLKLVHFNNLKSDLPGQMAEIAQFLEIDVAPESWPRLLDYCSFEHMRHLATTGDIGGRGTFKGGGGAFIYKGTNGRWRDVLGPEDIAYFNSVVARAITPECAHWLATGQDLT